jgi:Mg-chelatase subunit ChlD
MVNIKMNKKRVKLSSAKIIKRFVALSLSITSIFSSLNLPVAFADVGPSQVGMNFDSRVQDFEIINGVNTPKLDSSGNYIWKNWDVGNTVQASPAEANVYDLIQYRHVITTPKRDEIVDQKYDIIFALDWSGSMSDGILFSQNSPTTSKTSRMQSKEIILDFNNHIYTNYPDSRIAVLGMNTFDANMHEYSESSPKVDIPADGKGKFVPITEYDPDDIRLAFEKKPTHTNDDIYAYIKKANDLFKSRTDQSRIPVLILISDYQLYAPADETEGHDEAYFEEYWSTYIKEDAIKEFEALNDGIFIAVRADDSNTTDFGNNGKDFLDYIDPKMDENIFNGHTTWGKFVLSNSALKTPDSLTDYNEAVLKLRAFFTSKVLEPTSAEVTTTLSKGLKFISADPPVSSIVENSDGTYELKWDLSKLIANSPTTVNTCEVSLIAQVIDENTLLKAETVFKYGGSSTAHKARYHQSSTRLKIDVQKTAKVTRNGTIVSEGPGTEDTPYPVMIGDNLDYTITIDNLKHMLNEKTDYDIVFALDWSGSMAATMGSGSSKKAARLFGADIITSMSDFIFDNYPDSRIAIMGMSTGQPSFQTYIDFETGFLAASDDYEVQIENAFTTTPSHSEDDYPKFLEYASKKVNDRSAAEKNKRIPVIVVIGDYQVATEEAWNTKMNAEAKEIAKITDAILLLIKTNHADNVNEGYSANHYDDYLQNSMMLKPNWGWLKINNSTTFDFALSSVKDLFTLSVPIPISATLVDVVPAGLEIVSFTPQQDRDGNKLTWTFADLPPGTTEVTIKTIVKDPKALYENFATLTVEGQDPLTTNHTYHLLVFTLHIRTIVDDSSSEGVQIPVKGFAIAKSNDKTLNLATPIGKRELEVPFAEYIMPVDGIEQKITAIVPQEFKYDAHMSSYTGQTPEPGRVKNVSPTLDFSINNDWYVTLYLVPQTGLPIQNQTDFVVNDFEKIVIMYIQ